MIMTSTANSASERSGAPLIASSWTMLLSPAGADAKPRRRARHHPHRMRRGAGDSVERAAQPFDHQVDADRRRDAARGLAPVGAQPNGEALHGGARALGRDQVGGERQLDEQE